MISACDKRKDTLALNASTIAKKPHGKPINRKNSCPRVKASKRNKLRSRLDASDKHKSLDK
ncbi:unnamed protein product [Sphenostylis stenocarpa]|uniref:Uncharacterized protein n=1 Tax=Sphenostylis stenocarpa TaxID=92480 RepID=A0AA86SGL7_9FABA|nr:unnamed protein product [Sphenostylis stenocarpa]